MSENSASMKDFSKRLMGCLLVLAVCIGTQAVCPMMLFPQSSQSCARHHSVAAPSESNQGAVHDCCPRKRTATKPHCTSPELNGTSVMSCCSVPAQPATATQPVPNSVVLAVLGHVSSALLVTPERGHFLAVEEYSPPLRGVLSLKEDLRI